MGQLIPKDTSQVGWRGTAGATYVQLPSSSPKLSFVDFTGNPLYRLDAVDMEMCLESSKPRGQQGDVVC